MFCPEGGPGKGAACCHLQPNVMPRAEFIFITEEEVSRHMPRCEGFKDGMTKVNNISNNTTSRSE